MKFLILDVETDSLDRHKADVVLFSYAVVEEGAKEIDIKVATEFTPEIKALIENPEYIKVAYNIKFEYQKLKAYGINLPHPWYDPMIAFWLLQEGAKEKDYTGKERLHYGLKNVSDKVLHLGNDLLDFSKLSKTYGHKEGRKFIDAKASEIPPEILGKYCQKDVWLTWKCLDYTRKRLKEENLEKLFYKIEMPCAKIIADMELFGVRIDTEYLTQYGEQINSQCLVIEQNLNDMGFHYNFGSPKQLETMLYDELKLPVLEKTKTGRSVSTPTLFKLKDKHEVVPILLEYKKLTKLYNTYVKGWLEETNPETGRVYFDIWQTGTDTGRLSGNNQQTPKKSEEGQEVRKALIADQGYKLVSADYSQMDLRILAHHSQDKELLYAFNNDLDLHDYTSQLMECDRLTAKAINFGLIYGKAQPLGSKVLTPNGWTRMGKIRQGDIVCSPSGFNSTVLYVTPSSEQDVYEITMSDGSTTRASKDHLWEISTAYDRQTKRSRLLRTVDIIPILRKGNQLNVGIRKLKSVNFDAKEPPPLHPYILGALLGDGSLQGSSISFTCAKSNVKEKFIKYLQKDLVLSGKGIHYRIVSHTPNLKTKEGKYTKKVGSMISKIKQLGLYGCRSWEKFIPKEFLLNTVSNRELLLEGLLNTDGYKIKNTANSFEYCTVSSKLARDVKFLVKSLGWRCSILTSIGGYGGKKTRRKYRLFISKAYDNHYIKNITYIGKEPCRCIKVNNIDGLYVTDDFIVTHNSAYGFARDWGISEKEAQKFLDNYFNKYVGVKEWMKRQIETTKKLGYTITITGRKRKISPDIRLPYLASYRKGEREDLNRWKREAAERTCLNSPIQGGTADVAKIAMIKCTDVLCELDPRCRLLAQIHDELVFEVPEAITVSVCEAIKKTMETAVTLKNVPLKVNVKGGLL